VEKISISRDLTKWPRLIVVGDDVTEEQANEILVRTNQWWLCSNDRHWERMVYGLIGVRVDDFDRPDHKDIQAFESRHRVLDLHYPATEYEIGDVVRVGSGKVEWTIVGKGATSGLTLENAAKRKRHAQAFEVSLVRRGQS
jgi:hypothetical protein